MKTLTLNILFTGWMFFLMVAGLSAQEDAEFTATNNAKESLRIAQGFVNDGLYKKAKRQLEYTINFKDNFAVAHREMGRVCLELEHYDEAITALEPSFALDEKISRAAYFECGEAYFQLGDFSQALHYFNVYEEMEGGDYANKAREMGLEKQHDLELPVRKENIRYIEAAKGKAYNGEPRNLGKEVNSEDNEYLPAILSNGQRIVYTRDRRGEDENILTAARATDSLWTPGRAFDEKVNTHSNEGMAKFTLDGRRFYFTGCKRPDTQGGCDIYEAHVSVFGEVTRVKHVEGINTDHWDSQPCVSCNSDAMYFSSNRPEGYGGTDIYVSYIGADGVWGKPINLGPNVNSEKDEEGPFVSADGKTLYFTSDGWPGYGDGDIFMSNLTGNEWGKARNLGVPINSPSKELGFYLSGDSRKAYFASARPGGQGGLDLYEYPLPEELRPKAMNHVQGIVVDDETGEPIETPFVIRRLGERYDYSSNEKGEFFTCLNQDKAYTFHLEVKGYQEFMSAVYLPKSDNAEPTMVEIRLVPNKGGRVAQAKVKKQNANPRVKRQRRIVKRVFFYFDINSSELNPQTKSKLEDLISTIKFDDKWAIEVIGFADSSGDAEYNKILSEKRANSVADYLKASGIIIDNVMQEGRGALTSETETEKKKSRRVEVVMRGLLDEDEH